MSSSPREASTRAIPTSVDYVQASGEAAMRALANIFATGNSDQESINPRHVLLGLSAFFHKLAMSSESDPLDEEELAVLNPMDGKSVRIITRVLILVNAEPMTRFEPRSSVRVDGITTTSSFGPAHSAQIPNEGSKQPAVEISAAPVPIEPGSRNSRESLEQRGYTSLELDALQNRGSFPSSIT
jgi:hypothetical protein